MLLLIGLISALGSLMVVAILGVLMVTEGGSIGLLIAMGVLLAEVVMLIGGLLWYRSWYLRKVRRHEALINFGMTAEGQITRIAPNALFNINNRAIYTIVHYSFTDMHGTTHQTKQNWPTEQVAALKNGQPMTVYYDLNQPRENTLMLP